MWGQHRRAALAGLWILGVVALNGCDQAATGPAAADAPDVAPTPTTLYSRDELKAALGGLSKDQVIKLLGAPSSTGQPGVYGETFYYNWDAGRPWQVKDESASGIYKGQVVVRFQDTGVVDHIET